MNLRADIPAAAATKADPIRYSQCWEDADILLEALAPKTGSTCVSICSAGDNTLSLLSTDPDCVIAIDSNPSQLHCLKLRVAAYRTLSHGEMLAFLGIRPSEIRHELYLRCRPFLPWKTAQFWDAHSDFITRGFATIGKFERYFSLFRNRILPLAHSAKDIAELLRPKSAEERIRFYKVRWNNWRWRILFNLFFSRAVMGRIGREKSFFRYAEGSISKQIKTRTEYALTELDPSQNPYLHFILTGTYGDSLPHALREENFKKIRANLDRLTFIEGTLQTFLSNHPNMRANAWNLSDVFEYLPVESCSKIYADIADSSHPGARLAYWNMAVPRSRPDSLKDRIVPLHDLSAPLHGRDRAFFYRNFIVEEIA